MHMASGSLEVLLSKHTHRNKYVNDFMTMSRLAVGRRASEGISWEVQTYEVRLSSATTKTFKCVEIWGLKLEFGCY